MNSVISRDGTQIAWERSGNGPALILVDGALCSRAFGPSQKLAAALSGVFTVYRYDRRGRGQSSDTPPYSLEKEIEDLAALIDRADGAASLLGLSSGGALALHAAAAGLMVERVIAYEPPYVYAAGAGGGSDHEARLQHLLANGKRGGAVTYFMRDMVGAPAFVPILMRLMPWIWHKLEGVAHTLPYDASLMTEFRIPHLRFASICRPVLVLNGAKTDARLKTAARVLAATIPRSQHAELAGQTHNVKPDVLAAAAREFMRSEADVIPASPESAKRVSA